MKKKVTPPLPEGFPKTRTGITGLDEITQGGLPKGRPTLICGNAGCGKTLLGIEFLVRGVTEYNEPGVFMAFEETAKELAERKKAEEKIKQLSQAVEQSPSSVVITDLKGNIQYVNKKFVAITGYAPEEVIGKNPRILKSGYTSSIDYGNLWKQVTSGLEWQGEFLNKKKNGELYWESALISPIINEKGEIINFLAIKEDITERKKAEEIIRKSEEQYRDLVDNITDVVCTHELDGRILSMNKAAEKMLGFKFDPLANFNIKDILTHETRKKYDTYIDRIKKDECVQDLMKVRLPNGDTRIWEFNNSLKISDTNTIIRGYARDITERKKAEEALQESEETFRRLFTESADPILLLDETGFTECNQAAASILGYSSPQEVLIKQPWEISPEKQPDGSISTEKATEMIAKALQQGNNRFEWIHTKKDGTEFPVEVMLTPIILKGKQFFYTIWRDITERKIAEKEIRDYKLALDETSLVDISDSNGIIRYANENFCRISKYSKQELIGQSHRILNSGYHPAALFQNLWNTISEGKIWKNVVRNRAKDGSYFWVDTTIVPFLGNDGKPFQFITICSDITNRKNAETRMKEAIERYEILSHATSDTIWDWNIENNTMLYNDGITKVFGYNINQVENAFEWYKNKIHSDDIQKVDDSLKDIFEKGIQSVQLTYRFRCADGSYKHVFDRAVVIFDNEGKPVRMIGAMQDITYQKEEEIRVTKAILDAQEKERSYLSAELHDNINQILAASLLTLGITKSKRVDTGQRKKIIETAIGYISDAISETRKLSHNLAPANFKETSLKELFENLLLNINVDKRFIINLHFDQVEDNLLTDDIQVNLYRILQEQMRNIINYSAASEIEVALSIINNTINLRIFDNGKGFDTKIKKTGIGLSNMRKRAESLSGKFILNSAPGKGCEIIVEIPLSV